MTENSEGNSPELRENKFIPSWLIDSEEEFISLRRGERGSVGKKMAMLHQTGLVNTAKREDLSSRLIGWGEEAVEEDTLEDVLPYFAKINNRIEEMDNVVKTREEVSRTRSEELLEEQVGYQREQLTYEKQQLELMRKGYKGFILGITKRLHVNPEQYDQQLPPWFEVLDFPKQRMLSTLLHINYLAAIKEDDGMSSTESWVNGLNKLNMTDEALVDMVKDVKLERLENGELRAEGGLPGFRYALATMTNDIFDNFKRDKNGNIEVDKQGNPILEDHFVISSNGYEVVGSEKKFDKYKRELAARIEEKLESDFNKGLEEVYRVSNKDLAELAVASVDSLLFATGAYDSGDEKRAIKAGDARIYSESLRSTYMPGTRGKKGRWLPAERDLLPGVSPRDFGGPIGRYIRENSLANREGFQDKVRANQIKLIPERMFYSLFDHARFNKESQSPYAGKSCAEALIQSEKREISSGVLDFAEGANAIPIIDLERELFADYSDTISAPLSIFKHVTSDKEEDHLNRGRMVNALIKAREDPRINDIFTDEDLVTSCVVMAASHRGLVPGIPEMILDIDDDTYDDVVYNALVDNRLFEGMKPGFRQRLVDRLHARDLLVNKAPIFSLLAEYSIKSPEYKRRILREKAKKNIKNETKR